MAKTVQELKVWQRASVFASAVFAIVEQAGFERERELREQIKDATDSMVSNIDEGFEQSTDRGFARYLYTSKGSTAEVRRRLALAVERRALSAEEFSRLNALGDEVARVLTGLIKYLVKSDRRNRGMGGTRPRRR